MDVICANKAALWPERMDVAVDVDFTLMLTLSHVGCLDSLGRRLWSKTEECYYITAELLSPWCGRECVHCDSVQVQM